MRRLLRILIFTLVIGCTFTAPSESGTYYFQCDVHPSMNGDSIVE